jgi:hypothetical protein
MVIAFSVLFDEIHHTVNKAGLELTRQKLVIGRKGVSSSENVIKNKSTE